MSDAVDYHQTLAAGWSQRYQRGGMKRRAAFFCTRILPRLALSGTWLDIGCGSGIFSAMLAEAGAQQVQGFDGAPAMIAAARAAGHARCVYHIARLEEMGALITPPVAGAICLSVLEYVAEPECRLADIVSWLAPGGRVVLSLPNANSLLRSVQRSLLIKADYLDTSRHMWTKAQVRALAQNAGLEVEAILGFDPLLPPSLFSPSLWFLIARKV